MQRSSPEDGRPAAQPPAWLQEGGGILEWVARACGQFPERTAVEGAEREVTYAALDARANEVADRLRAGGIGPKSIVVVVVQDRIEIISAMLGVFRAGCVFVPLSPDCPPERLRRLLSRLSPDALLAGAERPEGLSAGGFRVLVTITPGLPLERCARPRAAGAPRPGHPDMAYIYYTSGSTGEPKGAMGTLAGLSHFIGWEAKTFGIGPGWRVSQLIMPTFDPYFRDVLLPLCTGGTICIPPEAPADLGPDALMGWLDGRRINLVHFVPSLFGMLLDADLGAHPCRALRYICLAGEALQVAHVKRWRRTFGDRVRLVNLYGSTETTMVKLFHVVREQDLVRDFIPIGRPIDGAEVLLLDGRGRPCPPGTVGEIHVRSRFLTLGYYGDPEASRKAFLDGGADARVYRTGDLGAQLPDGSYQILGRTDDQVKVRGVRVGPSEVTSVLSQCPQVRSCIVVSRTTPHEETILVAYIVPAARRPLSVPELRTFLRRRLLPEMVPSAFVCLQELPLTARGKVDRAALPAPDRSALAGGMVPPRTPTEAALAALWRDLLGLEEVGVHDDFLLLGGHSLTALRLAARVRSEFGIDMPVRVVFDRPTVEEMAAYVARELGGSDSG